MLHARNQQDFLMPYMDTELLSSATAVAAHLAGRAVPQASQGCLPMQPTLPQ